MSAEEQSAYKALIGTIGGHKGYLTRLSENVHGYLDLSELDGEQQLPVEELRDNIRARIGKLEGMFDELLANPHVSEEDIENFEKYIRKTSSVKYYNIVFALLIFKCLHYLNRVKYKKIVL